jgi:aminoglycoside 6'-N-acetyltransferase
MEKVRKMGAGAIVLVGVPEYYPMLGFKRASEYGLVIADGSVTDAFMVYELTPGYLKGGGVFHEWAPEFDIAEKDDAEYEAFHKQFVKEYFSGELLLRRLCDCDVPLMESWVHAGHVAPWFGRPEEWLHEIRNRHGEFSFLTHFIAEFDGKPIGFCQYYDCFHAKKYEDWPFVTALGETFSLDFLIGEPEYLGRGLGNAMIAGLLDILRNAGAKSVAVHPDEKNEASRRVFLANGFVHDGEYHVLQF